MQTAFYSWLQIHRRLRCRTRTAERKTASTFLHGTRDCIIDKNERRKLFYTSAWRHCHRNVDHLIINNAVAGRWKCTGLNGKTLLWNLGELTKTAFLWAVNQTGGKLIFLPAVFTPKIPKTISPNLYKVFSSPESKCCKYVMLFV